MNHSIGDGTSFWNFFNTWSEISRTGAKPSKAIPIFGREYLDGIIDLPIRIPFFNEQIQEKFLLPTEPLQQRVFHFRKEKIAELKSKANAQMGTSKISSLQALMGHLWVSITRTRHLTSSSTDDQETKYLVIVGTRQRLQPPLSDHYLGNAVLFGWATSTVGDLIKRGLGWAALELNRMVASQTEQQVKKFLEDWFDKPRLLTRSAVVRSHSFVTGSSPRFDVYGNDFGWGKPVAVRSGSGNKFDGKLTVFAGAEEGSIDFEACLSPHTLRALAEDEEFMQSVAV
ncbi:hypothetical protein M0R45_004499 [Rubus argutus]